MSEPICRICRRPRSMCLLDDSWEIGQAPHLYTPMPERARRPHRLRDRLLDLFGGRGEEPPPQAPLMPLGAALFGGAAGMIRRDKTWPRTH